MSAPTYEIAHVRDFLKVPADRRGACLEEFKDFLGLSDAMMKAADAIADAVGADKPGGSVESFTWIDDGESNRTINIATE